MRLARTKLAFSRWVSGSAAQKKINRSLRGGLVVAVVVLGATGTAGISPHKIANKNRRRIPQAPGFAGGLPFRGLGAHGIGSNIAGINRPPPAKPGFGNAPSVLWRNSLVLVAPNALNAKNKPPRSDLLIAELHCVDNSDSATAAP
jgi:hypothetical protein